LGVATLKEGVERVGFTLREGVTELAEDAVVIVVKLVIDLDCVKEGMVVGGEELSDGSGAGGD
jgi:hypothetical protein